MIIVPQEQSPLSHLSMQDLNKRENEKQFVTGGQGEQKEAADVSPNGSILSHSTK